MNWKMSDAGVIRLLYIRWLKYGQSIPELAAAYKRSITACRNDHITILWQSAVDFMERLI